MNDHPPGTDGDEPRPGLDEVARQARSEVESRIDPTPPTMADLGDRLRRQRRQLVASAGTVVVVVAVIAGIVVIPDGEGADENRDPANIAEARLVRSERTRSSGDPDAIPDAVTAENAFAVDLYQELATSEDGNLFFSPHSIATTLSMVLAGADGDTRAQIADALHVEVPEPAFHEAINALDRALVAPRPTGPGVENADPLELTTANSLWAQAGYPFRDQFLDRLATSYGAGMNVVDFTREAEASRAAINAWVAKRTDGEISELIPEGVISDMTRLVLVNTITFEASWAERFEAATPAPFSTAEGRMVRAPMMRGGAGTTARGEGWRSVAVPYAGGASMVVIVPDDLADFERRLSPELINEAASGQRRAEVTLPRFSIDDKTGLKPALGELGVTDAFQRGVADLSRMDENGEPHDLFVKNMLHQALIEVDETGTKAVAATGAVIDLTSGAPPFVVDQPFVFAIRDDATGAVLFSGRVADPTA